MKITKTERKVLVLAAIFIAVSLNIHRLFILLPDGPKNLGTPWVFNLPELIYQVGFQFLFCLVFGYFNLRFIYRHRQMQQKDWLKWISLNTLLFIGFLLTGIISQHLLFANVSDLRFFRGGYLVRFTISAFLMSILLKILSLYQQQRVRDLENERLQVAYHAAEMKNLKAQINPHFLFNALSSLSALVREKPVIAQEYIAHLSKVFRYSLSNSSEHLVPLKQEIELLHSNIQLLKMRFEEALVIELNIPPELTQKKLVHMSLQPLLENAVKHNHVSAVKPLYIEVFVDDDMLVFKNSLNPQTFKEPSTGIGLLNLNERYKIIAHKEIDIESTATHFTVKIPLI